MSQNSSKRSFALIIGYVAAGMVLIVIMSAMFGLGSAISGDNGEDTVNLVEHKIDATVKSIDISDFVGTVKIVQGDSFAVHGKNLPSDFLCEASGDTLKIEGKTDMNYWMGNIFASKNPIITLTMPKDFVAEKFKINIGAGKLVADMIAAKDFDLKTGAGKTTIDELIAEGCTIVNGAGETEIKDGEMGAVNIDSGVGSTQITSKIEGNCMVKNGIGETELRVVGTRDDYYITCKNGIGTTKIDGESAYNSSNGDKNAKYTITAENGIGEIDIKFIR